MSSLDYENTWQKFWSPLLSNNEGFIDMDLVKKELHDYHFVLENVGKVYCHITGGLLSKPNYAADVVIAAADDQQRKVIDEILTEERNNQ